MIIGWIQLLVGLAILILGGEFLVRSAVRIAIFLRISSMVIGLTIVSFGTSFPELVVSVNAALDGYPDISIGNVLGSNIANLAFVLGLTTLIFPLGVNRTTVTLDWPLMLIVSGLLVVFSLDGELVFWEGALFVALLSVYNVWLIRNSKLELEDTLPEGSAPLNQTLASIIRAVLLLVVSIVALIFGADLLVEGAVVIARGFGIEERIIALSIIALGTSAPELATSIVAIFRKETAIGVGNLIGSNIFNILGILGITALIHPVQINEKIVTFDFYWMIGIPLLLYPILLSKMRITRIEGGLLLLSYIIYIFMLF
jgi:cation:H+ antiporter